MGLMKGGHFVRVKYYIEVQFRGMTEKKPFVRQVLRASPLSGVEGVKLDYIKPSGSPVCLTPYYMVT